MNTLRSLRLLVVPLAVLASGFTHAQLATVKVEARPTQLTHSAEATLEAMVAAIVDYFTETRDEKREKA